MYLIIRMFVLSSRGLVKGDPTIKVTVSIRGSQKKWVDENHINLSSVLRKAIDKIRLERLKVI